MKIGDTFSEEFFDCETCESGDDYYYIGQSIRAGIRVLPGSVFTEEMASYAVDDAITLRMGCI